MALIELLYLLIGLVGLNVVLLLVIATLVLIVIVKNQGDRNMASGRETPCTNSNV